MGYHRPVASFNIGKKGEHAERTHFVEPDSLAPAECEPALLT
jgi:ribonucleoside-triphosphate reductase